MVEEKVVHCTHQRAHLSSRVFKVLPKLSFLTFFWVKYQAGELNILFQRFCVKQMHKKILILQRGEWCFMGCMELLQAQVMQTNGASEASGCNHSFAHHVPCFWVLGSRSRCPRMLKRTVLLLPLCLKHLCVPYLPLDCFSVILKLRQDFALYH